MVFYSSFDIGKRLYNPNAQCVSGRDLTTAWQPKVHDVIILLGVAGHLRVTCQPATHHQSITWWSQNRLCPTYSAQGSKKKKKVTTTQFPRRLIKEKAEVRQSQGSVPPFPHRGNTE
jgi:hypothetical protein